MKKVMEEFIICRTQTPKHPRKYYFTPAGWDYGVFTHTVKIQQYDSPQHEKDSGQDGGLTVGMGLLFQRNDPSPEDTSEPVVWCELTLPLLDEDLEMLFWDYKNFDDILHRISFSCDKKFLFEETYPVFMGLPTFLEKWLAVRRLRKHIERKYCKSGN